MSDKFKHTCILTFLFLVIIPFVFIRDFYPFSRLGMFAEKIDSQRPLEEFYVGRMHGENLQRLPEDSLPLKAHVINYLGRNYYYRNEKDQFLEGMRHLISDSTAIVLVRNVVGDSLNKREIIR